MTSVLSPSIMDSLNIVFLGNQQMEVRREPLADLAPDEVLLQTSCTLISTGTECTVLRQKFEPGSQWENSAQFPATPGYGHVGRILAMGADVAAAGAVKMGERYASTAGHRQRAILPGHTLFPMPASLTDEEGTWATLSAVVQHGVRKANIQHGEVVVVIGLGLLGQLAVQFARVCGAGEVIAIDTAPKRLAMAEAHGATHVLGMGAGHALDAVKEITGGKLADVVLDITGNAIVFGQALKLLRRFGRLMLIGAPGAPSEQRLTSEVMARDLQIIGAHAINPPPVSSDHARWSRPEMVELFYKFLTRGQMRVNDLITHRYAPEQAPEAYQMLIDNRDGAMGVLFQFTPEFGDGESSS